MPYIKNKDRKICERAYYPLTVVVGILGIKGTLNYLLFRLAKYCCHSYADYSNFIAELECTKLEIYRRQIAPYEDKKIEENGDVE